MSAAAIPETVQVLLVVQYTLLQESLGRLLSTESGFKITGQCSSAHDGLAILMREPVDVVLLDLDLGKQFGQDFIQTARRLGFGGRFLLLVSDVKSNDVVDFLKSGICGVFLKSDPGALLAHGIRDVVAGNVWFKQEHLQTALYAVPEETPSTGHSKLTQRESDVLALVAEGLSNRQIGVRIGVSEGSVKAALQQLFSKFGVRSRSRLIRIVLERHSHEPQG